MKVLGCFALIDKDEIDWKLIVVDVNDPLSEKLDDTGDVQRELPDLLGEIRDWLQVYKVPGGTPPTKHAYEPKGAAFAVEIARRCHDQWKELIWRDLRKNQTGLALQNLTVDGSPYRVFSGNKLVAFCQLIWQKMIRKN